jgi:hypothetical protein
MGLGQEALAFARAQMPVEMRGHDEVEAVLGERER